MRKQRGITLIALVVTIIILLILAGVAIATLTGDNGLLQKATTSKEENERAKELELIKLAVSAAKVVGEGTITRSNLINELRGNFGDKNITVDDISEGWKYQNFLIYNNGIIEHCREGELPDSYQQVEYIESSGTQYIDTGISYQDGTPTYKQIEVKCAVISGSGTIWGVASVPDRNRLMLYTDSNWRFISHVGNVGSLPIDSGIAVSNNKTDIRLIENNLYIDNVNITSNTVNNMIKYTSQKNIPIFGKHDNNGYTCFNGTLRVYSFTIKSGDGSSFVRNLIPCYRKLDNEIGMYDIANYEFYKNRGTGTFGYGMEDGTYVAPTNN